MSQNPGLSKPAKLIEFPFFYFGWRTQQMTEPATIALISDRLDLGFGFRDYGQVGGPQQPFNAFPLWCDEVSVSVHLNLVTSTIMPATDGSRAGDLSALPTFSSTTLRMEALSNLGPFNQSPNYIVANEPEDVTGTLSSGYGVMRTYTPASRVIRMALRGSWADASAASCGLTMEVTARCKNMAPLLAMAERAWGGRPAHIIERPLGDGANGIIRSLVPAC